VEIQPRLQVEVYFAGSHLEGDALGSASFMEQDATPNHLICQQGRRPV
jgi:hypothetical protein